MSIAITAAELVQIRSDISELLPDTCNILSLTKVSDSQGGNAETWGTATANAKCRVDAISGDEKLAIDQLKPYHKYVATLLNTVTITTAHRLEHKSNTYIVEAVNEDQSWIGCHRVILQKI